MNSVKPAHRPAVEEIARTPAEPRSPAHTEASAAPARSRAWPLARFPAARFDHFLLPHYWDAF